MTFNHTRMPQGWLCAALLLCTLLTTARAQSELDLDDPCDYRKTIRLPSTGKCLVPVKTAMSWVTAQAACETKGGTLYQLPDVNLGHSTLLGRCLAAMPEDPLDDIWANAVGTWSQHWSWIDGTILNPVDYCSNLQPPNENQDLPISGISLSVDYCVAACHDSGATFVVLHNNNTSHECYCRHTLADVYRVPCSSKTFNFNDKINYYIVESNPNSLIEVGNREILSNTQSLCATVSSTSKDEQVMKSSPCFNVENYICDLGVATQCDESDNTQFTTGGRCLQRVETPLTWLAARSHCQAKGGDLWNLQNLDQLDGAGLDRGSSYWLGATNYKWEFQANSTSLGRSNTIYNQVKCGHMTKTSTYSWTWGETVCDQDKSFVCQFDRTYRNRDDLTTEVDCPWAIPQVPTDTTGEDNADCGVTPVVVPAPVSASGGDDSFPLAAVISAIVAGLMLLTCLSVAFAVCGRRRRKVKQVEEQELAIVPYLADSSAIIGGSGDYGSQREMCSVSEHGSQVGLMKGGYMVGGGSAFAMSNSYNEQSGMFNSKSLDRGQKEAMHRKLAESQHYLSGHSSMDERGFASTYNTMPSKPKDYMTLQAQMEIQDDAELAAMSGSMRGKPEVTLVTDNVDMNFTVNHAVSQGHPDSERSRSSLNRTMEEITVPASEGGGASQFSHRATEAKYFTNVTSI